MDWRAFRASLVLKEQLKPRTAPSSWGNPWGTYKEPYIAPTAMRQPGHWAHEISAPEQGCLLVARSTAGMDPVLQQSVILLCSHAIGELVSSLGRINLSPVLRPAGRIVISACFDLQPGLPRPCSAAVPKSALPARHRWACITPARPISKLLSLHQDLSRLSLAAVWDPALLLRQTQPMRRVR